MNADPAEKRVNLFRFLTFFAAARANTVVWREAREAAARRVHLRETWVATVCFLVSVTVAACVSVWMHPPDCIDTQAGSPVSTSAL